MGINTYVSLKSYRVIKLLSRSREDRCDNQGCKSLSLSLSLKAWSLSFSLWPSFCIVLFYQFSAQLVLKTVSITRDVCGGTCQAFAQSSEKQEGTLTQRTLGFNGDGLGNIRVGKHRIFHLLRRQLSLLPSRRRHIWSCQYVKHGYVPKKRLFYYYYYYYIYYYYYGNWFRPSVLSLKNWNEQ